MIDLVSKQEAFTAREGEVSISIDKTEHAFRFTKRWFRNRNQMTFSTFLPKHFNSSGVEQLRMIQIGVFEGMDLVWCLQNILVHPESRVVAIDPWLRTRKIDQQHMNECWERAQHNLRPWRKKVEIIRDLSKSTLQDLMRQGITIGGVPCLSGNWDMIIIDGDHNAPAVYEDAIYSLKLVRKGGWLLFDDVRNNITKKNHVADGLRHFLEDYGDEVKLVWAHRHCNCYEKVK